MTRLEDALRRDLHVIADRATPSHDAWQQILLKDADQEPTHETEIIMLTDNTLPTRRWPLVAAAAALVFLVIGAIIAFGTGGEDETVPASQPDTGGGEVAPLPRTFTLSGSLDGVSTFVVPDDGVSPATMTGTQTWTGDVTGRASVTGTAVQDPDGDLTGQDRIVIDATVDGIGSGLLIIDDEWASTPTIIEATGTIVGGTGDFAGATGTFTSSSDIPATADNEINGPYTLDLTLPG